MADGESTPVNILNVIRYPIGGIRSYLQYTYPRLDPSKYRTTIVTVDRPEAGLLPAGMAPLEADLVQVGEHRAPMRLAGRVRSLLATGRYTLVHAQGFTAAVVSVVADPVHRVPRVVTLHETLAPEHFPRGFGLVKRALLSRVLCRMDRVIVVGDDARANLAGCLRLPPRAAGRVQVIRNGVAVEALLAEAERSPWKIREQSGVGDDTALIGFVGRFMPEKGFDLLIDAVARIRADPLPTPPFKVIAVNDGAFVREYRREVTERGIADGFVFLEFRPSLAGLLRELDATVMPSRREACPLVAMEAMIFGCPLIASDCIGLREVTREGPVFVARTGDAGSLANALRRFLGDQVAARRRAEDYAPAARVAFDSSRTARELESVFAAILAGEAPKG